MSSFVDDPSTTGNAEFLGGQDAMHYIGGEWVVSSSGRTVETYNPSTGSVLARIQAGDTSDIDAAVRSARAAFEGSWSRFTPAARGQVLLRLAAAVDANAEELARLEALDMGAPITRTRQVVASTVELLQYYAGAATKIHGDTATPSIPGEWLTYTVREPIGVVGAIIPWNGPAGQIAWKVGPALAAGCTVVLKPAEDASLSVLRITELVDELDIPAGVLNVVTGLGDKAGAALCAHDGVDKVSFTGSTQTGQAIVRAAAGNLKRLTLELGGKSPDIVFADADFDLAVPGAAQGVFENSGQMCFAGTRIYVEKSRYDEFVERAAAYADSLEVGHSLRETTQIGPLISKRQLERVNYYLDSGRASGARVSAGDAELDHSLAGGYFVRPTVFADVNDEMQIACEEIFGPVASILPFTDTNDVLRRANNSSYGLGGGVWTRDIGKAHRTAAAVQSGTIWVNTYGPIDPAVPFGGYKMSGWGRELSMQSLDPYLNEKSVWVNTDV